MPETTRTRHTGLRVAASVSGIALLGYLIWKVGAQNVVRDIETIGWRIAWVIALGGLIHLVRTCAWRLTLTGCRERVSFSRLLQLRLASEALGQMGIVGLLFGEGIRVSALHPNIPIERRISSVTLDRALFVTSGVFVTLCGMVTALAVLSPGDALRASASIFSLFLMALLILTVLVIRSRLPVASAAAKRIARIPFLRQRVNRALPVIRSSEAALFDFHRRAPRVFWASVALNVASQVLSILEICLILQLLGVSTSFLYALVFEALTKLVNALGSFNPGNLGTYEGGNVLIARMLGMTSAAGLSVAVCRRIRALFWAAAGSLCLLLLPRSKVKPGSARTPSQSQASEPASGTPADKSTPGITTVIFAHQARNLGEPGSPLRTVGTLPVLLRLILSIRRVVGGQIIVCVNRSSGRELCSALLQTRRLPPSVDWLEVNPDLSLPELMRQIAARSWNDRLMLVAGNSTYHPQLFRRIQEWSGETGALALTDSGRPIGLWALMGDFTFGVTCIDDSPAPFTDKFHAYLVAGHSFECRTVHSALWQSIRTPEDRAAAERKLDRWLIKPTDGIFARLNRRVSVPISRALARFPITPNMISILTLGVGFAAGVLYARGGYWNTLTGALLSLGASILDGCDGEIARMKLMESDFGCWLETICDYLYYLFIFAGMALGLMRSSGNTMFLVWGAVLLGGAILSMLATGLGRQWLAARRPEQYLSIWQKKAADRRSNPILYFGRHTEFIARRCFWPYALLVFAVCNLSQIALFMAAIGANLVWLISLHSYRAFAVAPKSSAADPRLGAETAA